MGRGYLTAPLDVLREQLRELRTFAAHPEIAAALRAARVDADELLAEIVATSAEADDASAALRAAHDEREDVGRRRKAWRASVGTWFVTVRRCLDHGAPTGPARDDVRLRLAKSVGASFRGNRDKLELTLSALRTHASALGVAEWFTDPLLPAEALLAAATELEQATHEADQRRARCSDEAARARARAQDTIRRLRAAWELARVVRPALPDLPLDVLRAYRPSARPKRDLDSVSSNLDPVSSDLDPVSSDLDPVSSDLDAVSSDLEAVASDLDPELTLLVGVRARNRVESAR